MVRIHPRDKDAQTKLTEIDKELRPPGLPQGHRDPTRASPPARRSTCNSMDVDDAYDGPRLSEDGKVTEAFVRQLTEHFKRRRRSLHRKLRVSRCCMADPAPAARATLPGARRRAGRQGTSPCAATCTASTTTC